MKKFLSALLLAAALIGGGWDKSHAASTGTTTLQDAVGAAGDGTVLNVDPFSTIAVRVTISDTAEVTFKASLDGVVYDEITCTKSDDTAYTAVTSASGSAASGLYFCPTNGNKTFIADVTSWTSGTVTVKANASTAVSRRGGGGAVVESDTLQSVCGRGCSYDGADAFGSGLDVHDDSGDGIRQYVHPTEGPKYAVYCGGVEDACDRYTKIGAGKKAGFKDSSGNIDHDYDEATGVTTIIRRIEDWFDVAACSNATPSLIYDVPTANSPAPLCDTGSNTQKAHAAFDAATDESFELSWIIPTGFVPSLGIDIMFRYKQAATTGSTGWCAQLVRVPIGATSDPAYPAQAAGNCVSDAALGTTLQENLATITGVTCTSCVAGDRVYVRISRDANGGAVTDDAAGDAFLQKIGRVWRAN
jgi:hypothetical protein